MSRWEIGGDWSCRPSCASEPGLVEGATLTLVEAPGGLVLLTGNSCERWCVPISPSLISSPTACAWRSERVPAVRSGLRTLSGAPRARSVRSARCDTTGHALSEWSWPTADATLQRAGYVGAVATMTDAAAAKDTSGPIMWRWPAGSGFVS